jgi:hypothetical protein
MNIEPPNLNIPLERKERWGFVLFTAGVLSITASTLISPLFARAFAASCIVGLPIIWLFLFPPQSIACFINRAGLARFAVFYLVFFSYLALAKRVLIPLVATLIDQALA